jgi:hypothetical protein
MGNTSFYVSFLVLGVINPKPQGISDGIFVGFVATNFRFSPAAQQSVIFFFRDKQVM